jgi:hypothetical protein
LSNPCPTNVNLLTNSSKLLHHYSSILNVGPTAAAIDLTPVLNHLNQRHATEEARFIQAAAAKASKEELAVQEWLGDDAFNTLLRLSGVPNVAGLAPVWRKMAVGNHRG